MRTFENIFYPVFGTGFVLSAGYEFYLVVTTIWAALAH
jgi:hypothetical protein